MTVAPVAIVGAGPTGLAVAIELKRRGISHVVFDKGALVDSIRRFPVNMVFLNNIFIENGRFHGKRIAEHVAARL